MQIQTILNRFEKYSSFVYGKCRLVEDGPTLEVEIKPRKNGKPVCSKCGEKGPTKIEPLKKVAKALRKHQVLILNWFRAKGEISQAAVEGLNNHRFW